MSKRPAAPRVDLLESAAGLDALITGFITKAQSRVEECRLDSVPEVKARLEQVTRAAEELLRLLRRQLEENPEGLNLGAIKSRFIEILVTTNSILSELLAHTKALADIGRV